MKLEDEDSMDVAEKMERGRLPGKSRLWEDSDSVGEGGGREGEI